VYGSPGWRTHAAAHVDIGDGGASGRLDIAVAGERNAHEALAPGGAR
jgi:hypothetical protein